MPVVAQFTPTFEHQEWVDNIDRVTAGGRNGFNSRFNALKADLNQLSSVIKSVDDALQARPASKLLIETTTTIPAFVSATNTGGIAQVPLGTPLPLTSHVFHQISVRPEGLVPNIQVFWMESAFIADTGVGPPLLARMLRLEHRHNIAVTVNVRILRLEMSS